MTLIIVIHIFSELLSFEVVYYKMFILSKMYFVSFLKKEFIFLFMCMHVSQDEY